MKQLTKILSAFSLGFSLCYSSLPIALAAKQTQSVQSSPSTTGQKGHIEFRVGSTKTTVISGARVIVINHEGKIIATGLTDSMGVWNAFVPLYKVEWNEHFTTKGVVTAIVIANGYNEQIVFVVPITEHTIQPVVLQPIVPNGRNLPSRALGNIHSEDLRRFIERYAEMMKLKRQAPVPGDPGYAPWSPEQMQ